jgi:hypothetical protein
LEGLSAASHADALILYDVVLSIGFVPRVGHFRMSPTATVKDIEIQCIQKWDLDGIDVEVACHNFTTEQTLPLKPDDALSSVEVGDEWSLVLIQKGAATTTSPTSSVNLSVGHITQNAPKPDALRLSVAAGPDTFEVIFKVEQRGIDRLPLKFPLTATVKDAKIRLAAYLKIDQYESITIMFSGKPLKENWVLKRLRLDTKPVVVVFKDLADILIVTSRAMRT